MTALDKLRDAETDQDRSVKALEEAVAAAPPTAIARGSPATTRCSRPSSSSSRPRTTLAQIRRDRLLAYVALYKALGGGWKLTDAQWTAQNELAGEEQTK